MSGRDFLEYLSFFIGAPIPLVSSYYIALYTHNDMQIGLLNKCMGRVESLSCIPEEMKFYKRDGNYSKSFYTRRASHRAVVCLCFASPIIILMLPIWELASMGVLRWEYDFLQTLYFLFAAIVSSVNVFSLFRLQWYREKLRSE